MREWVRMGRGVGAGGALQHRFAADDVNTSRKLGTIHDGLVKC